VCSSGRSGATSDDQARLGVSSLDELINSLVDRGVADSMLKAYTSGKKTLLGIL